MTPSSTVSCSNVCMGMARDGTGVRINRYLNLLPPRHDLHRHVDWHCLFRPLLCYLEGAWTNDVNLDEPFDSDRHLSLIHI